MVIADNRQPVIEVNRFIQNELSSLNVTHDCIVKAMQTRDYHGYKLEMKKKKQIVQVIAMNRLSSSDGSQGHDSSNI